MKKQIVTAAVSTSLFVAVLLGIAAVIGLFALIRAAPHGYQLLAGAVGLFVAGALVGRWHQRENTEDPWWHLLIFCAWVAFPFLVIALIRYFTTGK